MTTTEKVRSALSHIAPTDRALWVRMAMAVKSELGDDGFDVWSEWSQNDESYSQRDARDVWRSVLPNGKVTGGTLFYEAKQRGWRNGSNDVLPSNTDIARREAERQRADAEAEERRSNARQQARQIWEAAGSAPVDHAYLARKGVGAHSLRIYVGTLSIGGIACDGALIVPVRDSTGELHSLEFITASGEKRYLPGGRLSGCYFSIGKPANRLHIAEGYATGASIHEATGDAVAVAFNAGNLEPAAKALREKFPDLAIVMAADNDCESARNVGIESARKAASAVGASVAVPELGEAGADFNDLMRANGADAVRAAIDAATVPAPRIEIRERRELPNPLPPVPSLNMALLPESVKKWVADHADGLQVPPDYVAIGAMVALGGTIGRQVGIAVKQKERWIERPILWGAIVGRPSAGKSPALRPAYSMLSKLESSAWDSYEQERRNYETKLIVNAAAKDNAKNIARKKLQAGDHSAALAAVEAAAMEDEEPQQARLVINEATVQKVGEILNANPRGLVLFRDELSGWLASLDREGREGDRAFWLECWSGMGPYTTDTIGRGSTRVEACAVSMLGGIQPGKLAEYVRGAVRGGYGDDGLMQRFGMAIYPDPPSDWSYTDRPPDPAAQHTAWLTFQRLNTINTDAIGCVRDEFIDVPYLHFCADAQGLFIEWMTDLMRRVRSGKEPPFLESHFGKYPALVARLALVNHLADNGTGAVSGDALARALDWTTYLEGHARRIYAPVTDGGLTAAHALLSKRDELQRPFTAREVRRHNWAGLPDQESVEGAIGWLEEYCWLEPATLQDAPVGGRPTIRYQWCKP